MNAPPERITVTMFSGGRGGGSIASQLLRTPGIVLSLVINGYDNGKSTGALRRYLPGMLGPSDFRKNLLHHLDSGNPGQEALNSVLHHRLSASADPDEFSRIIEAIAFPGRPGGNAFAALAASTRTAIVADLAVMRQRLDDDPGRLDLTDCALANLVLAGAYLRLGGDFNAAVGSFARTFEAAAELVNVTNGENAFLVALKQDGRILADEADIVEPHNRAAITDLYLLSEPVTPHRQARLEAQPIEVTREMLVRYSAVVSLSPEARTAIERADLLVYGPGTPHSSLLPSYLTPGIGDAIAASRARAKVFVVNILEDNDVRGLNAADLVSRTLGYLGDADNSRRPITHVLCHGTPTSADTPGLDTPSLDTPGLDIGPGIRWIVADLEDPTDRGVHCGQRTVAALTGIADAATLVKP